MIYTIKNDVLSVDINSLGAQMWSIKKDDTEYLWQGDATYWPNRATTQFPYIARLTEGKYTFDGKEYSMEIHGFAKNMEFEVVKTSDLEITFSISQNEQTLAQYPFLFNFSVTYAIIENSLEMRFKVENTDNKTMYFGVGTHPGFNIPLEDGLCYTDYKIVFNENTKPVKVGMSPTCFVTDDDTAFEYEVELPLHHDLFDNDAILLKNIAKGLTLKSDKGQKSITVEYPSMEFLAIWSKPKMKAPYVCIEPWSSSPSRYEIIEDFAKQDNLVSLNVGETYNNVCKFTFE